MRANGLPKFPDPTTGSGGMGFDGLGLSIEGDLTVDGITYSGPAAKRAEKACKAYLPGGGPPPPPLSASRRKAMLANAECMRTHGVPNFPDPTFPSGGGARIQFPAQLNPQSPAFQRAAKACGGGNGPRIFVGP
jgi:hypothetical protein